jgi:hypothetical protein
MSDELDTSDGEAETDTEAETDGDTDTGADSDSDSDSETDADAETDTDTDNPWRVSASDDEEPTSSSDEPGGDEPGGDEPGGDEPSSDEPASDEPAPERPAVSISAGGDRIKSGDITVAGKHFADWFNQDLRPMHPGKHPTARPHGAPIDHFGADVNKANFIETFRHCTELYAPQLSFHQFVAMFCIFYNETGGRMRCVSEGDYLPTVERRLRAAMRYNKKPNLLAGTQLAERGIIDESEIAAWSTTTYPGPSGDDLERRDLFEAAQECDFFKYRGRGLNQLTWRPYVTMILDPLLKAAGYGKTCDELSEAELSKAVETDPRIGYGMTKSYFTRREFLGQHFAAINNDSPDWRRVGKGVSGDPNENGYAEIYAWRCETLRAAMEQAGWQAD